MTTPMWFTRCSQQLRQDGINVWYDEGISPGEEWTEELGRAIQSAERVLFFVTPSSVDSRNCRNEILFAQNHDTPILPVYLEETRLPVGLDLTIGASQALRKSDLSAAIFRSKLVRALTGEPGQGSSGTEIERDPNTSRRHFPFRTAWIFLVAILMVVAGIVGWLAVRQTDSSRDLAREPSRVLSRSVLVMPFDVIGSDDAADMLASGVRADLKGLLSGYHELQTLQAESSLQEVDPTYRVTGNVQASSNSVRFLVHLVRTAAGVTVWSKTYELSATGDAAAQRKLAQLIAHNVRLQLVIDHECESIKQKTLNQLAARYACAGMADVYLVGQPDKRFDIELWRSYGKLAIEHDPDLADSRMLVSWYHFNRAGSYDETMPSAIAEIETAVRLEPDNPVWAWWLGYVQIQAYQYHAAQRNVERALELDPLSPWAHWYHASLGSLAIARGELTSAVEHFRRAIRLYDADARMYWELARLLNVMGKSSDALASANAGLELATQSSATKQRGVIYEFLIMEKLRALDAVGGESAVRPFAVRILADPAPVDPSPAQALLHFYAGQLDAADRMLTRLTGDNYVRACVLHRAYVWVGDMKAALESGQRCFTILRRFPTLNLIEIDPLYDTVRDDPQWTALRTRVAEAERRGNANAISASHAP